MARDVSVWVDEAAALVGAEPWDSTRGRLLEGEAVSVLLSSQRRPRRRTSDVWLTVISKRGRLPRDGEVQVTLAGPAGSFSGGLDARGSCVIRDVPAGTYCVAMRRVLGPAPSV
jgi:hypothetical protein